MTNRCACRRTWKRVLEDVLSRGGTPRSRKLIHFAVAELLAHFYPARRDFPVRANASLHQGICGLQRAMEAFCDCINGLMFNATGINDTVARRNDTMRVFDDTVAPMGELQPAEVDVSAGLGTYRGLWLAG